MTVGELITLPPGIPSRDLVGVQTERGARSFSTPWVPPPRLLGAATIRFASPRTRQGTLVQRIDDRIVLLPAPSGPCPPTTIALLHETSRKRTPPDITRCVIAMRDTETPGARRHAREPSRRHSGQERVHKRRCDQRRAERAEIIDLSFQWMQPRKKVGLDDGGRERLFARPRRRESPS